MQYPTHILEQDIYRLFVVLAQFLFTTSETEIDYYKHKIDFFRTPSVSNWQIEQLALRTPSASNWRIELPGPRIDH